MNFVYRSINSIISLFNAIPFLIIVAIGIVLIIVSSPEVLPAIAFNDFPLNKTQNVEFPTDLASFKQLTNREKKDQLRDWLVFTIASDRDFTADRINTSLSALPPVRYGYNNQIANFEYTETRHLKLGNNTLAALVPKISTKEKPGKRIEDIAHIADSYRKDIGTVPDKIQIFEYELNADGKSAKLTHTQDINGGDVFSNKYGYYTATITSLKDLENFTKQVNDLTDIYPRDNNLVLGGRNIVGRPTLGMSVKDIAALWQSYRNSQGQGSGFSLDWDYDYKALAKDLKEFQSFLSSLKLREKSLPTNQEIQKVLFSLGSVKAKDLQARNNKLVPYLQLIDKIDHAGEDFIQKRNQNIDDKDRQLNNQISDINTKIEKFKDRYLEFRSQVIINQKNSNSNAILPVNIDDRLIQEEKKFIAESNELATKQAKLYKEKQELEENRDINTKIEDRVENISRSQELHGYQFARYDGDLKGTEVGMTLFYTDLVAKLWMFNYANSIPIQQIQDFLPVTRIAPKVSSIYKNESEKNRYTRLWFDPQEKGYQKIDNSTSLLFAPTATKVNAKSSDPLNPQTEKNATPDSQAFLGWWDRHYDEVAQYEHQYQKLNQIMKWSLAISWLETSKKNNYLAFLNSVKVNHDNQFPDWVKSHKQQLKFFNWDEGSNCQQFKYDSQTPVCFYKKNYQQHDTETMPLLHSENFTRFGEKGKYYSGGVSLANKSSIVESELPKLSNKLEPAFRSDIKPKSFIQEGNGFTFTDRKGTIYKIVSGDSPSSTVKLGEGLKLRSSVSEFAHELEFTSNVSRTTDGIKISQTANGIGIGDFTTTKTRNGFKVGFESREMDKVNSLAMDVSTSKKSPADFFADHPDIQTAYTDEKTGVFYTELKNSDRVLEWIPEAGRGGRGGTTPPGGGGNGISGGGGGRGGEPPQGFVRMGFPEDPGRSNGNYSGVWIDRKKFNPSGKRKIVDRNIIKPIAQEIPRKKYSLSEIDKELKNNPKIAALMIKYTIDLAGRKPSLMIRQAVIEIKAGQRSVRGFDSNTSTWIESKGDFLKQINGILDRRTKLKLIQKNDPLFKLVKKDDAFIYVQDSPGLNNLDWSQPIESSLPRMAPIKIKIYNLGDERIGGAKLSDLGYEPYPALPNEAQNYEVKSGNFSQQYPMPQMAQSSENCQGGDDGSTDPKPCNHKPVYVVIEASDTSE